MPQHPISYFADMAASPLLATALSVFALTHFTKPAIVEWCLLVIAGAGLWTLAEYVIHRFIYHRVPVLQKFHEVHHTDPRAYVGAPPMVGTNVVFLVSFVPLATYSIVLANAVSVGMLLGYAIYMVVHHACHFWTLTAGGYLFRVRLHHAAHHYRDDDGNFGVTTSFWDRVLGTRIRPPSRRSLVT
jgi:sterol desaturase/sphingolipid hydroxylase (fatty acid hydroxylase superfamily)